MVTLSVDALAGGACVIAGLAFGVVVGSFFVNAHTKRRELLLREQFNLVRERMRKAEEQRDNAFDLKAKALAVAVCERSRLKEWGDVVAIIANMQAIGNGDTLTVSGFDLYDASGTLLLREPDNDFFTLPEEPAAGPKTEVDVYEH